MRPCNRYAIILGALATLLVGASDSYASQKRNIEVLTRAAVNAAPRWPLSCKG